MRRLTMSSYRRRELFALLVSLSSLCGGVIPTLSAQSEGSIAVGRSTEFAALALTEARLRLGQSTSPWEVRTALYYRRDTGLREYAGAFGMLGTVYHGKGGGQWAAQAFYLDLADGREGALFRLEYQYLWRDLRIAPIITVRQERLSVTDAVEPDPALFSTWRTRVRVGVAPVVFPNTRLLALVEAFPVQQAGNFVERRSYVGLIHRVNPSLITFANYMLMQRSFGPVRTTHHPIVGVIFEGVLRARGADKD